MIVEEAYDSVSEVSWQSYGNGVYDSLEWDNLREEVLNDADYVCAICAGIARVAHHLTYRYGIICSKRYLLAVCRKCHELLHEKDHSI